MEDLNVAAVAGKTADTIVVNDLVTHLDQAARAAEGVFAKARARVAAALRDLGPGLGDMVLRCCCFLEGLEAAERRDLGDET